MSPKIARPEGNWRGGSLRLPSLALPGLLWLLGLNQKKGGTKTAANFSKSWAETPDFEDRRLGDFFFVDRSDMQLACAAKKGRCLRHGRWTYQNAET